MTIFDYKNNTEGTNVVFFGFVWAYTETEEGMRLQFYRELTGPRPERPPKPARAPKPARTPKPAKTPRQSWDKPSAADPQLAASWIMLALALLFFNFTFGTVCADYLSTTLLHTDFGWGLEILVGVIVGVLLVPVALLVWLWIQIVPVGTVSLDIGLCFIVFFVALGIGVRLSDLAFRDRC